MYSHNKEVNSASASIEWYALRSCANSGVHCAFNFLVLATIASDCNLTSISGIVIEVSTAAVESASKSPLSLSAGCL